MRIPLSSFLKVVCLAAIACLVQPLFAGAEEGGDSKAVTSQITKFYAWYIHAIDKGKNPLENDTKTLNTYVTAGLVKHIHALINSPDGLEADYFVDAQDVDPTWTNGIAVQNVTIKDSTATADLVLTGKEFGKKRLKLSLKKDQDTWKLDKVTPVRS